MTEKEKLLKKKNKKTETIGFRLEPKLRFAAELAARKQRRSLSSFIEWAVAEAVKVVPIKTHHTEEYGSWEENAIDAIQNAWDVDEADRFANLAFNYPDLLTHEEEVLWKIICENGWVWKGRYVDSEWSWTPRKGSLIFKRLRENWETFKKVAAGELDNQELPGWANKSIKNNGDSEESTKDTSNDIPF